MIILFNAVILSIFIPLGFAIYNIFKRDIKFPHLFLGYKMDVNLVTKRFVWLMEKVENGKLFSILRASKADELKPEEEVIKLKEQGIKRVWVTPQITFMITLTIGFCFAFLIGNIMFIIVNQFL